MVLSELRPESWMRATCSGCCCSDRCQGASIGEGTNYRTAAQQTLTLPWGHPSISPGPRELAPLLPIQVCLNRRTTTGEPQGSSGGSLELTNLSSRDKYSIKNNYHFGKGWCWILLKCRFSLLVMVIQKPLLWLKLNSYRTSHGTQMVFCHGYRFSVWPLLNPKVCIHISSFGSAAN